ncbi:hypothetical protein ORD22_03035 [Sporosarcina sp. GW1-11]|uniref:hypothetical protein n=1 Tax=Sporosarcina sp. GW1-11 TaxID=2899126 RepID=UPI00294F41AA|nr:hypothetical protein [Sporosarcina sp. GW1-11]MDV6377234.1 hypothetical protein [Sporosarcina sp. GW1-11]
MKGGLIIKQDERGMTLVEVLATLLLVTLVVGLIWTTVSISSRHNILETDKLKLQQEGNYITTEIQRLHRTCKEYEFVVQANKVSIENCKVGNPIKLENHIISEEYSYSLVENIKFPELIIDDFRETIEPKSDDLNLYKLIITDPQNTKLSVAFPLIASRYKKDF